MKFRLRQVGTIIGLLWFCRSSASVLYVDLNSTNPTPPYVDWSTAATNIQDAVNAASIGDNILVTNGLYRPGGAVSVMIPISIVGVSGSAQTIIDGGGTNRCVYLGGGATLTGFTLTNGYTMESGGDAYCETTNEHILNCVLIDGNANNTVSDAYGYGGGVYEGTLSNCVLSANSCGFDGGGAYYATLINCIVSSNSANNLGGGVESCVVYNSTLSSNSAGNGGGNVDGGILENCNITDGSGGGSGNGAYFSTLDSCILSGNRSDYGGGARFCTLSNCTLSANFGSSSGGAAESSTLVNCFVVSNSSVQAGGLSSCTASNCIIEENTMGDTNSGVGGGAWNSQLYNCLIAENSSVRSAGGASQCTLVNCTVVGNSAASTGGGVDSSTLTNCIVYFNTSPVNGNYSGTNHMSWCCTVPLPGTGISNISSPPAFADEGNGNFRLAAGSPCLGAGNVAVVPVTEDLDGNPRTFAGTVDLGAYESPGPPSVAIQPISQTVPFGEPSVSFNIVVTGRGSLTYEWLFNGTNILDATNSALVLSFAQYSDAGSYSVIVTNDYGGTVSSNAILNVVAPTPPTFTLQPANQIVPAGTNVVLTAIATGAPAPSYQWYFNGGPLTDNDHYSGTTGTNLQISNAQTNDSGNYHLLATNTGGSATSLVATLTVYALPQVLLQPVSQLQLQGSNATFTAVASGSPPLGYQWLFNGTPLTEGGQWTGTMTTNLTVSNLSPANGGNYVLLVTNAYGSTTSAVATLTVLVPAAITAPPTNCTVLLATNASFSVTAVGTAPLSYIWYFNGTRMTDGGRFSGTTSSTLNISNVQTNDAGPYLVIVTNNYGSATSSVATLTVLVPAQIIGQPASQAVLLGSNATFSITAVGTSPLTYQWYFNGAQLTDDARISGSATPALAISNVQSSDAGGYVALVTNPFGSATSQVASLTPQAALAPSIRYVALTSTNPMPPFLDWSTAATNIQDAVDASVIGDSVLVSNGIYNSGFRATYDTTRNRVVVAKSLTLKSVNGPMLTVINGSGIRCIYLTNGAVLTGFTLTNGLTSTNGAGVWCGSSSTIVSNCIITGNFVTLFLYGGGAFGGTLINCTLTNNAAGAGGGAASNILLNCTLVGNIAGAGHTMGAGAYGCALTNCLVVGNRTFPPSGSPRGDGGGAAFCTLVSCVVSNNAAGTGGGVSFGTADHCLISSNWATPYGGGAYSNMLNNCVVQNNFASSFGGGIYMGSVSSCLVSSNLANRGGGIYGSSSLNSIVHYNSALQGPNFFFPGNIHMNYCCTLPLPTNGIGNISNDPIFVDLSGEDFHLQSNSPCINSGNNAYVTNSTDFDGNPRIVGGTVDIGAYEYQTPGSVISYAWLQQYGLPTDGSVDYADLDGTSFNVYQDWVAGLNPTNAASVFVVQTPQVNTNSTGLIISWLSVSNRIYFLQSATNLAAQPAFSTIQSNIVGQIGTTSFTDSTATNGGPYFYRVGIQ